MRLANVQGRAGVVVGDGLAVDVARASDDRFGPDVMAVLADWEAFTAWAAEGVAAGTPAAFATTDLGPAVPRPAQVFAIGLNYRDHAAESRMVVPSAPMVFTKFASSVSAPLADVPVVTPQVDWEVELALVIGRECRDVPVERGWDVVAAVTAAQDYSARDVQMLSTPPQFSLGKSFEGFLPVGPVLVTPDELPDRDAVPLSCSVNGQVRQSATTRDLIFDVPTLVAYLSSVCALLPGDLVLTGTPPGVGLGMQPPTYLAVGDEVVTRVEGVGELRNRCVAAARTFRVG